MFETRPINISDKDFVQQALANLWGSEEIVYSGEIFNAGRLPGFITSENGRNVGLITYNIENNECQIISINALTPGKGIGTLLIDAVKNVAKQQNCSRIFVVTTNDNLSALKFYQKRGFVLMNLYPNALEVSRKIKPQIPETGEDGIPLRDEIELEKTI